MVTVVPYAIRDDKHGLAGLSHVGKVAFWLNSRTSILLRPTSINGLRTACCAAACLPGRKSPRSSIVDPSTMLLIPRVRAIDSSLLYNSSLQKKQRFVSFAR